MSWFEDLVRERLNELSTRELIAQNARVDNLQAFSAAQGDLSSSDAFNVWIVSNHPAAQTSLARGFQTEAAWSLVPSLASEAVERFRGLATLAAEMRRQEDDTGSSGLRGRYDVGAYVVAMLMSQLYERLSPKLKQTGALPKLANLDSDDRAFLKLYHDARDSYEHWDERVSDLHTPNDGRKRDRLLTQVNHATVAIGRSSTVDGALRLAYGNGEEVIVSFSTSDATRLATIVSSAEDSVRTTCSSAVLTFLDAYPTAKWFARFLGHAAPERPFKSPSD